MVVYGGKPETKKTNVEVIARFSTDGTVTPIWVIWPDGRRYELRVTRRQNSFDRVSRSSYMEFDVDVVVPGKPKRATKIWFDYRTWWVEAKA